MKTLVFGAAMLAVAPFTAMAQTAPATPAPAATAAPVSGALTGDTPIETVMASPKGKAAIEKTFPEIPGHGAYDMFKSMSLRQLQPLAGDIVTEDKIKAFEAAAK